MKIGVIFVILLLFAFLKINKPIKIIKKLNIDPMLNKSNKYPICVSGSLNCSDVILKRPYKIINKAETVPVFIDFL